MTKTRFGWRDGNPTGKHISANGIPYLCTGVYQKAMAGGYNALFLSTRCMNGEQGPNIIAHRAKVLDVTPDWNERADAD